MDSASNQNAANPEMERFREGLRQVLSVPKSELKRLLAEERASKTGKTKPGPKPKVSPSDHVSAESV
jgi:hypothetical protein